jgi:hypothetical protein
MTERDETAILGATTRVAAVLPGPAEARMTSPAIEDNYHSHRLQRLPPRSRHSPTGAKLLHSPADAVVECGYLRFLG